MVQQPSKVGQYIVMVLLDIKNTKFINNTAVIQSTSEDIEVQRWCNIFQIAI